MLCSGPDAFPESYGISKVNGGCRNLLWSTSLIKEKKKKERKEKRVILMTNDYAFADVVYETDVFTKE